LKVVINAINHGVSNFWPFSEEIFDGNLKCVYRGQFDDSRPGNDIPVTRKDLKKALDCLLSGASLPQDQKPSIGCNIESVYIKIDKKVD